MPEAAYPSRGTAQTDAITLVTVVHSTDLPLLALQARSIARFGRNVGIEAIHIFVNDRDAAAVMDQVRHLIPHYGALSERVRVFSGSDVFENAAGRTGMRALFHHFISQRPILQLINRGGWKGNDGWRLQQAFKLASARVAAGISTPLVVSATSS